MDLGPLMISIRQLVMKEKITGVIDSYVIGVGVKVKFVLVDNVSEGYYIKNEDKEAEY